MRFGLCSSLSVQCDTCGMCEFFSPGKHDLSDSVPRTLQGKDMNRRAVFACNEVGIGREALAVICEIFDMPPPVSPNAWTSHDNELYKQHLTVVKEEVSRNVEEVKELHKNEDESTVVPIFPISVSFDGTLGQERVHLKPRYWVCHCHRHRKST